ncbi:hypothetical protein ABZ569_01805 [Streptomyces albus]|uniref:hypothetical protein n=1 Tax=Streptomyces albus TaxID=1888 RepID=UPI0033CB903D
MRMRTVTRSLAIGLAALGLAAAGATTASACGGHHEYNSVHKEAHKKWTSVDVDDNDTFINGSQIFAFGPMQND